jgi:hypothetical protein
MKGVARRLFTIPLAVHRVSRHASILLPDLRPAPQKAGLFLGLAARCFRRPRGCARPESGSGGWSRRGRPAALGQGAMLRSVAET